MKFFNRMGGSCRAASCGAGRQCARRAERRPGALHGRLGFRRSLRGDAAGGPGAALWLRPLAAAGDRGLYGVARKRLFAARDPAPARHRLHHRRDRPPRRRRPAGDRRPRRPHRPLPSGPRHRSGFSTTMRGRPMGRRAHCRRRPSAAPRRGRRPRFRMSPAAACRCRSRARLRPSRRPPPRSRLHRRSKRPSRRSLPPNRSRRRHRRPRRPPRPPSDKRLRRQLRPRQPFFRRRKCRRCRRWSNFPVSRASGRRNDGSSEQKTPRFPGAFSRSANIC